MSSPQAPLAPDPSRADLQALSLDARIALAERRVVQRDAAVGRHLGALTQRVGDVLAPWRTVLTVVGGAGALFAGWRLFKGGGGDSNRTSGRHRGQRLSRSSGFARTGSGPWVGLLGLAMPLLPRSLRRRVNPAAATAVLTLGVPLVQRYLARKHAPPLETETAVDVAAFAGRWHVLASATPDSVFGDTVTDVYYRMRDDGTIDVDVMTIDDDGELHTSEAVAKLQDDGGGARWQMSRWPALLRWLPLAWTDHWIVHLDTDGRTAIVGDATRERVWLLSRDALPDERRLHALVRICADRGFDVDSLSAGPD